MILGPCKHCAAPLDDLETAPITVKHRGVQRYGREQSSVVLEHVCCVLCAEHRADYWKGEARGGTATL